MGKIRIEVQGNVFEKEMPESREKYLWKVVFDTWGFEPKRREPQAPQGFKEVKE
jgi:hypothetical protein